MAPEPRAVTRSRIPASRASFVASSARSLTFSLLPRVCSCVREPLANSLYNNVLIHHFPRLFRLINQLFGITIQNKRTHRSDLQVIYSIQIIQNPDISVFIVLYTNPEPTLSYYHSTDVSSISWEHPWVPQFHQQFQPRRRHHLILRSHRLYERGSS